MRPETVLEQTDWRALEHSHGPAWPQTPRLLAGLLTGDRDDARRALSHLWEELFHQGTIYGATPAAARFVAAALADPRVRAQPGPTREYGDGPLAAALLHWLSGLGYAMGVQWRELFGDGPFVEKIGGPLRPMRPRLHAVVTAFLDDPDDYVRDAALIAAVNLASASELAPHRAALSARVRATIAADPHWCHTSTAVLNLRYWGEHGLPAAKPAKPAYEPQQGSYDDPPF
ncbi:hypothetical protein [Actinoplanes regularis]|uniref:HEAT repeat-containing protein n=1 Tax=Actinoplanes regularis TaxID=52697 RepID=A0A239BMK8_9ACTN|nr:hypothetical protein [Actinoplanes regularis]GIE88413.1 hypothetical protein Are01nite_48930 [Actinoplanes regularis]SNS09086.1 hypothetical protein SAMN06264365_1108 [Actinoplanes regularis]